MKEIIGKSKLKAKYFPSSIIIYKTYLIKKTTAQKFNELFVKIGPKLAKNNSNPKTPFESSIQKKRPNIHGSEFIDQESEKSLANLKLNKSSGWKNILSNVLKGILREKCPDTDLFLVRIFLYSD